MNKTTRRHKNRLEKTIMKCVRSEIKPRWASLWGQREWIRPAYCGIVEGDGRHVVWLQTGDSRPSYYILRIDSSTDMESGVFNPEFLLEAIEEQFSNVDDFEQEYINGELKVREKYVDDEKWLPYERCTFPVLSTGNGYWWGQCKNFKP